MARLKQLKQIQHLREHRVFKVEQELSQLYRMVEIHRKQRVHFERVLAKFLLEKEGLQGEIFGNIQGRIMSIHQIHQTMSKIQHYDDVAVDYRNKIDEQTRAIEELQQQVFECKRKWSKMKKKLKPIELLIEQGYEEIEDKINKTEEDELETLINAKALKN